MIYPNGWTRFNSNYSELIKERGGVKRLARQSYARTRYRIMKEFNVLPTDERFQALTDDQIEFLAWGMVIDNEEQSLARKGVDPSQSYRDDEADFWDIHEKDFQPKREEHDEADIANQVEELLGTESTKKIREKLKTQQEFNDYLENGGEMAKQVVTDKYIEESLKKALAEAKARENMSPEQRAKSEVKRAQEPMSKLEKETINEAIDAFNDMDNDFSI